MSSATLPASARPAVAGVTTAKRHLAWLAGGVVLSFCVPFLLADQLELSRDLYYACMARSSSACARAGCATPASRSGLW